MDYPPPAPETSDDDVRRSVPKGLRISAAWSWRLITVAGALYGLLWILGYLAVVVIPLGVALLLAALLAPAVDHVIRLRIPLLNRSVPRGLATGVVLVGGLALVGGVLTFVITEFTTGLPQLQKQVQQSLDQIREWLINGPLGLQQEQIQRALDNAIQTLQDNQAAITSGALTTAAGVGEGVTGFLLVLFILIFFLSAGSEIWRFLVRGAPADVRDRVDLAGRRAFASLVSYVRATALVAVVDAIGIGLGLWIVGVPLAVPLAALTFLAAFVPIIGAVVAGAVAVLVALVSLGFVHALVVLAIVLGVQQIEGNVLQPLLLGRAVRLHPLAVVLAITVGLVTAGIAGALLSVPLLAVINAAARSLAGGDAADPETVDVLHTTQVRPEPPEREPSAKAPDRRSDTSDDRPGDQEPAD